MFILYTEHACALFILLKVFKLSAERVLFVVKVFIGKDKAVFPSPTT